MSYKVVETFVSINGEGQKSGELAVFIRLAGCNLDCSYCDTRWANQSNVKYIEMTKEEIYDYIKSTKVINITLTGGEPLLDNSIFDLIKIITDDKSLFLEIETNGSISLESIVKNNPLNLSFTVDYKSPSSLMEDSMDKSNFKLLRKKDTVKFVIGNKEDLEKAHIIINDYDLTSKTNVLISPVFSDIKLEEIVNYMKDNLLNGVKLQIQLHKIIWDPELKGV